MKECPQYVKKALLKRAKAAQTFLDCDNIVVDFLKKHGLLDSIEDYDILTGCESLCNPYGSSIRVIKAINRGLKEKEE